MKFKYKGAPEKYNYKTWRMTNDQAIQYFKRHGYKRRTKKEVLDYANSILRKHKIKDIKVIWATKKFLKEIPYADAGIFVKDGEIVIMIAPDLVYRDNNEIKDIIEHEIVHYHEGL